MNFTTSVALGDVDGDDDLDLVSGGLGPQMLYLNDGDGDPWDSLETGVFVGEDVAYGQELWRSDGTVGGTSMICTGQWVRADSAC